MSNDEGQVRIPAEGYVAFICKAQAFAKLPAKEPEALEFEQACKHRDGAQAKNERQCLAGENGGSATNRTLPQISV